MLQCVGNFITTYLRTAVITNNVVMSDTECSSPQCIEAAMRFDSNRDNSVSACESLYDHLCGNYAIGISMPDYTDYVDTEYERKLEINKKFQSFIDESAKDLEPKPGFQKVTSFYKSCTEGELSETSFYEQAKTVLKDLEFTLKPPFFSVPLQNLFYPAKVLAGIHATSLGEPGFLFEIYVKDRNYGRVIQFVEVKDSMVSKTRDIEQLKKELSEYIYEVSSIFYEVNGRSPRQKDDQIIRKKVDDIANFLIDLIKIQDTPYIKVKENTPMSVFDLQQWTSRILQNSDFQFNWTEFFQVLYRDNRINNLIQQKKNIILIKNQTQFEKIFQLLKNIKAETFVGAMWWYKVQSLEEFFPQNLEKFREKYHADAYRLSLVPKPQRCYDWIWTHFGLFINHLLATEENSLNIREKVSEMTEHVLKALAHSVQNAGWTDNKTAQRAIKKLEKMKFHIGFSDSVRDPEFVQKAYEKVEIIEGKFIETVSALYKQRIRNNFLRLFSDYTQLPYSFDENVVRTEVVYHQHFNAFEIPIAILGPPIYDIGLQALNYGSLGTRISHVLWYAIDLKGKNFNESGATECWWSSSTTKKFQEIVNQFQQISNEYIEDSEACTMGDNHTRENMASWTGFEIGLKAYRNSFKKGEKEMKLPKFTDYSPEKLFFLSFANSLCIDADECYLCSQMKRESMPPNIVMVNSVATNSKLFPSLWGCETNEQKRTHQKHNLWH